ncbi:unnamed protein product [Brassica rapa]|uniref:Trypsin family protein n=2 Tax=Brassica TaxID=3705 RepID=A0A3P5ZHF0_BRACM|nr:protein NARROW LEAF 1 isoform X1 [Brassica napus]XP_048603340.1 protein NARROW LEAF 1 isoform X2 [Brassica napus]CAG7890374.1 unnamed protein product [Brassica rapa]CAF2155457.1 unnamed protein product [Brassica napus]CDY43387.1 BnaA01g30180D [Brassica napus]VDC77589.1 unnamed protein product [Brassica rapa]
MRQPGSAGQHCEFTAASYFSWPTSSRLSNAAEERANYFSNLQKEEDDEEEVSPEPASSEPKGQRATTLLELMTIRAFHSKILRCYSLGTAIGFRIRRGVLTDIPAIIVFVSRKVHKQWLSPLQCLPTALEGAGGIWCDVDVVEFSYFGEPDHQPTPKQTFTTDIVDHLQGSDPFIGSGSQVASQETCGTLGAIVRSQTGGRQVGFVTNRHVAVNLDYPSQKMFHPLPPALGPGVYLGAVERATSFITDDLWFGIFAGTNPETFVRADGAFIPFADDYDLSRVTTSVKGGVGEIGEVKAIELQSPVGSLVGKQVVKVGRSSGLTTGTVLAYALEYNDERGVCFLTDFLVVGENHRSPFDLEGDSGSLIVMKGEEENARPIGIIWGGTGSRGRLKLKVGESPESWTTGVDLGRLLTHLQLDLITTDEGLKAAVQEQRAASTTGMSSMVADSSPPYVNLKKEKRSPEEKVEASLGPLQVQHIDLEERIETKGGPPSVEHQFMPSFSGQCSVSAWPETAREDLNAGLANGGCDGDLCVGLRLGEGDNGGKRRRTEMTKDRMRPAE